MCVRLRCVAVMILDNHQISLKVFSTSHAARIIPKIFTLKSRCRKTSFWATGLHVSRGGRKPVPQILDVHIQIWLTSEHVAKFSRDAFGDFRGWSS